MNNTVSVIINSSNIKDINKMACSFCKMIQKEVFTSNKVKMTGKQVKRGDPVVPPGDLVSVNPPSVTSCPRDPDIKRISNTG